MSSGPSKTTPVRRQRSVSSYVPFGSKKYSVSELAAESLFAKNHLAGVEPFDVQVAGHRFDADKKTVGMLKCKDGTVLKPVLKRDVGEREMRFYERLQTTTDPHAMEFREFCAAYHGVRALDVYGDGNAVEFLILENACDALVEPCAIDLKIGRVTCEPGASDEKKAKERQKYRECKEAVGFCVTGMRVHRISTDRVHAYDKDYGKRLNGTTIVDALRIFLNADSERRVCRELVVKLLSILWKIQKWARKQTSLKLYASSLLIVYDCKKLKRILSESPLNPNYPRHQLTRKTSFNASPLDVRPGGLLHSTVDRPTPSTSSPSPSQPSSSGIRKLSRSHSFDHNSYRDLVNQVKRDYASTLRELINDDAKKGNAPWFSVRVIDFGHAYFNDADDDSRDENYLEGVDNLVRMFEGLLESAV